MNPVTIHWAMSRRTLKITVSQGSATDITVHFDARALTVADERFELYGEVYADKARKIGPFAYECPIVEAADGDDDEQWPRLLAQPGKHPRISIDWGAWKSIDDDDNNVEAGPSAGPGAGPGAFDSFGGGGNGIDLASMLNGMGGMGGMGGMAGDDEEDVDEEDFNEEDEDQEDDDEEEDAGCAGCSADDCNDCNDTPADAPETPADAPETPADAPETPADAPETPADAPETPADAQETPADAAP